MSETKMKHDVESEEFTDELSDEALDREQEGKICTIRCLWCGAPNR